MAAKRATGCAFLAKLLTELLIPFSQGMSSMRAARTAFSWKRCAIEELTCRVATYPPSPPLECGIAPGRRQPGDIELLLDRHRQAKQEPPLAPGQGLIGAPCGGTSPLEIPRHHGIDTAIERFDPGDGGFDQLDRGNPFVRQGSDKFRGCLALQDARRRCRVAAVRQGVVRCGAAMFAIAAPFMKARRVNEMSYESSPCNEAARSGTARKVICAGRLRIRVKSCHKGWANTRTHG
jgi:hypothetical protein